jgi:vancomycin resistance protein YoaR
MAAGSVVFVLVLGLVIDSALYHNKVHRGVSVSGHDLGGLTPEKAKATLDQLVADAAKTPITLSSGSASWSVLPADAGTKIDTAATVSDAMDVSRRSNFVVDLVRRLTLHFKHKDIPLRGTIDNAKMDQVLAGIARSINVEPVNPGLVINGSNIGIVEGKTGRVVDQTKLRDYLKTLLLSLRSAKLDVPMVTKEPAMTVQDSQHALQQAKTMISAPVRLTYSDHSWTLTPEQIISSMDFSSEEKNGVASLVSFLSAEKLAGFLGPVSDAVQTKPTNATFGSDGEKAWVIDAVSGKKLDAEKTAQALTTAALSADNRTAKVVVATAEANRTTDEAKAMGIKDKLGSFSTRWEGTSERQVNVRITTKYASDVILAPGELYDFDEQIGPRTPERGYKMAPGIVAPGKLDDVFGGGICQVSTTLFNAVFFAGLDVVERVNHSIFIDHYPKGRDATVTANGANLRFRNDTSNYILIRGSSNGITTTFVIYGTDDGRTVSYTTSGFYDEVARTEVTTLSPDLGTGTSLLTTSGQPGRKIKVVRTVKAANGSVIHKDTFVSTWLMIPREIDVGTGAGSTTTTGSTTTSSTTKPPATTTTTAPKPTTTTATTTTTTTPP